MAENGESAERVTVRVVTEHPIVRAYLQSILERDSGIVVKREPVRPCTNDNGDGFPLVFVIDAKSPGRPLDERLRIMRQSHPSAAAIILDAPRSAEDLVQLLCQGAAGFVVYDRVAEDLVRAVRWVAKGNAWIAERVLKLFRQNRRGIGLRQRENALTGREMMIVGLLDRGMSSKEISAALAISEATVKFHVANILNKAGVHSRPMAIHWARINGILGFGLSDSRDRGGGDTSSPVGTHARSSLPRQKGSRPPVVSDARHVLKPAAGVLCREGQERLAA